MRIGSKFNFLAGLAVGYYLGTGADPERREQLDRALRRVEENPQVKKVRDTVRRNAGEVADAASERVERTVDAAGQRVADTVDTVGDKVEGTVAPDGGAGGASNYN
jgi:tripartite-type tricarboxylate transporter receptor subunit TctC